MRFLGMALVWTGSAGAFLGAAATVRVSDGLLCAGVILGSVALLAAGAAVMLRLEKMENEESEDGDKHGAMDEGRREVSGGSEPPAGAAGA